MGLKFSIIDLGSNSARLVMYQQLPMGMIQELDNIKSVLRLSSHVMSEGNISPEGIEKTIICLRRFKRVCEIRGITEILGVATAAIRMAKNRNEILEQILEQTGIPFRILSGDQEAYYGYLAVVNSMSVDEAVTIDIGGGSTEVTYFKNRTCIHTHSFSFGAVSLYQDFIQRDPASPEELKNLNQYIEQQMSSIPWLEGVNCPVIAIGGTARNLARIHQRHIQYSMTSLHHYELSQRQIEDIYDTMRVLSIVERKDLNGLSKDRADIIIPGLLVFINVMKVVRSSVFITSNKGLRDGLISELLLNGEQKIIPDVLQFGCEQFMKRYQVDEQHSSHVANLALQLYDQLDFLGLLSSNRQHRKWLEIASLLHDIGRSINIIESSKHTFYLLENVLLLGATHKERLMLGLISSYKNNKQLKEMAMNHPDLISKEDVKLASQLGNLLFLARILDRTMNQEVIRIDLSMSNKGIEVTIVGEAVQEWIFEMVKDHLKKLAKHFQVPFRIKSI